MRMLLLLGVITWSMESFAILASGIRTPTETIPTAAGKYFRIIAEDLTGNLIYSPLILNETIDILTLDSPDEFRKQVTLNSADVNTVGLGRKPEFWTDNSTVNVVQWFKLGTFFLHENPYLLTDDFKEKLYPLDVDISTQDIRGPNVIEDRLNDYSNRYSTVLMVEFVEKSDTQSKPTIILFHRALFSGSWTQNFNEEETKTRPFHLSSVAVKEVPTMRKIGNYRYGELPEVNSKFIEIPYAMGLDPISAPVSMFIVLPNEIDGFSELVRNIQSISVEQLHRGVERNIELLLPKFQIESRTNVTPLFNKLGLGDFFTDSADFSSLTDRRPLKIKKIVYRNALSIDEMGTRVMDLFEPEMKSSGPYDMSFAVDHPFISFIINEDGHVFYTIAIVDPSLQC